VPRGLDHADAGEQLDVAGDDLPVDALVVGLEVGAVERTLEAERELLLLVRADHLRVGVLEHLGVARVVEVQVREDDVVDLVEPDAHLVQLLVQVLVVGDLVVGEELLQTGRRPARLPVRRTAGVPQQLALVGLDEDAVRGHLHPVDRGVLLGPWLDADTGLEEQEREIGVHRPAGDDAELVRRGHEGSLRRWRVLAVRRQASLGKPGAGVHGRMRLS